MIYELICEKKCVQAFFVEQETVGVNGKGFIEKFKVFALEYNELIWPWSRSSWENQN